MGTTSDNGARPEPPPASGSAPDVGPGEDRMAESLAPEVGGPPARPAPGEPPPTPKDEAAPTAAEAGDQAPPSDAPPAGDGSEEARDAEADELEEVRAMLGDVRLPTELPRGYRPSESVREPLFRVELSDFAGPLDLLIYLIRKHQVDVLDIPIKFITQRYLGFLDELRALQIDVASEFLVLAAELTHIKSKMLLPAEEGIAVEDDEEVEEGDPRAELVRRLLEYQKYRDVAHQLDDRDLLGRDVFPRVPPPADQVDVDPGLKSVSIFKLVELMARMLRKAPVRSHEIEYETYSITERIDHVLEFGRHHGKRFTIGNLLATVSTRAELVVTFIAVLEMTKLGMVKLYIEESPAPETSPLDRASSGGDQASPPASVAAAERSMGEAEANLDVDSTADVDSNDAEAKGAEERGGTEDDDALAIERAVERARAAADEAAAAVDAVTADAEGVGSTRPTSASADESPEEELEPLPTIWIELTGTTRERELVDDYRG